MNRKYSYLTFLVLASMIAVGVKATSISKTIANINADASKPGGTEQVLKSLSASTHVPVATLEKEKASSGLSYGDLFAAHSISKASGKSFDEIAAMKAKGQSWDAIADANNVSLGGKKANTNTAKTAKTAAVAQPSPTPYRTLRQEQNDRWAGRVELTNTAPTPKPKKKP